MVKACTRFDRPLWFSLNMFLDKSGSVGETLLSHFTSAMYSTPSQALACFPSRAHLMLCLVTAGGRSLRTFKSCGFLPWALLCEPMVGHMLRLVTAGVRSKGGSELSTAQSEIAETASYIRRLKSEAAPFLNPTP